MNAPRRRSRRIKPPALPQQPSSTFDDLPEICSPLLAVAASELSAGVRPHAAIFKDLLEGLQGILQEEGPIFALPSRAAFSAYVLKLSAMSRRIADTRAIVATLAHRLEEDAPDHLTVIAAEAIKTLIYEMLGDGQHATPRDAVALASALKTASEVQHLSLERRAKAQEAFTREAQAAVQATAHHKGLSAETLKQFHKDVLGI